MFYKTMVPSVVVLRRFNCNYLIKQYDEVKIVSIGQGDDYTTGCLLDISKKITD